MGLELEHYQSLGPFLQAAREVKGVSLAQAARELRIRQEFLEALETESFEKIPHPVYISGFLRSYSAYLNVDGNAVLEYFHLQQRTPKKPLAGRADLPSRTGKTGNITLLLSILAAGLIYAGWYWANHRAPSLPEQDMAEIPLHLRYLTENSPDPKDKDFATAQFRLRRNAPYLLQERGIDAWLTAEIPLSWRYVRESWKGMLAFPGAENYREGEDRCLWLPLASRLTPDSGAIAIDIRQNVWLQITSASGQVLESRQFHSGETLVLPLGQGLILDAGDAKAIGLRQGALALPPLNAPGTAVRGFPLDSAWMLAK